MEVVENVDGETVKTFAKDNIDAGSEVCTDGYPTYSVLDKDGYSLKQKVYDPDTPALDSHHYI